VFRDDENIIPVFENRFLAWLIPLSCERGDIGPENMIFRCVLIEAKNCCAGSTGKSNWKPLLGHANP
jgi:hypothetical protein